MYSTIDEFLEDWREEKDRTERILGSLKDGALDTRVQPEGRSLRTLAWHLVTALSQMIKHIGLSHDGPDEDAPEPDTAAEILDGYRRLTAALEKQMRDDLTDAALWETHEMFGQQWTLARTLQILLRHEIHHRAQLTVLMRQAGLSVPGIYGPSREEWAAMGMEPMP